MSEPALVFHPAYDITFMGLEKLHPFDSCKYGRAWAALQKSLGPTLARLHRLVDRPANDDELRLAHSPEYLQTLNSSTVLATALELTMVGFLPASLTHWRVLKPMRWATRGTILAAQAALECGVAVNLSGGYHHAKPDGGEGFCIYSDIAIAVRSLRTSGSLPATGRIAYLDLDAHQGNGVSHQFRDDASVFLFDIFNEDVYPQSDPEARARLDCALPIQSGCTGEEYLQLLRDKLPGFLDAVHAREPIRLVIYNAGTDVIENDPLGYLALTPADVLARDLFVIDQCRQRGLPVVMVPSGGYTRESYRLLATSVTAIVHASMSGGA